MILSFSYKNDSKITDSFIFDFAGQPTNENKRQMNINETAEHANNSTRI